MATSSSVQPCALRAARSLGLATRLATGPRWPIRWPSLRPLSWRWWRCLPDSDTARMSDIDPQQPARQLPLRLTDTQRAVLTVLRNGPLPPIGIWELARLPIAGRPSLRDLVHAGLLRETGEPPGWPVYQLTPAGWRELAEGEREGAVRRATVRLGSRVRVRSSECGVEFEEQWEIVPAAAADARQRRISESSPLARALIGRRIGEFVRLEGAATTWNLIILAIDPPRTPNQPHP